MRNIILIFIIIVSGVGLYGQTDTANLQGKVSFVSSQNIYVKFKSTTGISSGDTLYFSTDGKLIPVLRVNNLSSVSCVCTNLSSLNLSSGNEIIARIKNTEAKPEQKVLVEAAKAITVQKDSVAPLKTESKPTMLKQKISGSLSAFSYSDFSNTSAANSTRLRYTLSLRVQNFTNSKFSIESYISFNHKTGEWSVVKSNVFNAMKIYSLAVRYDLNKTTQFSLGRKINSSISSIGAMDGLQFEKSINKFSIGAIVGSRPDYANYGFDRKLFQYGAYLAFNSATADSYSQSSLAFMQQMNNSKTDRRFLYFQHSNSLIKNIYFFSTFEIDLYRLNNDLPQNTFNLSGLYLSVRYKMTKSLSISGSYDARKNIMYYETYKTFIDQVIENEMRQSFRINANYRITRDLTFGLESGYRFLKSDAHPSKNVYSYITYSQIPGLNMSVTISGTYLESNYMNGKTLRVNTTRDFFKGKFQTSLGYRYVGYRLPENQLNVIQNIGELSVYWQFLKYMSLSATFEGTFEKHDRYNRLYLQVRKRF